MLFKSVKAIQKKNLITKHCVCQKERLINKRLFSTVIAEMCDIGVSLTNVKGQSKDSK